MAPSRSAVGLVVFATNRREGSAVTVSLDSSTIKNSPEHTPSGARSSKVGVVFCRPASAETTTNFGRPEYRWIRGAVWTNWL